MPHELVSQQYFLKKAHKCIFFSVVMLTYVTHKNCINTYIIQCNTHTHTHTYIYIYIYMYIYIKIVPWHKWLEGRL